MKELEYKTKYFGNIIINKDDSSGDCDVKFKDKDISIFFADYNLYGDKIKVCLEIIDKYIELHEIAKKTILESFAKNDTLNYYFECHFDLLEKADLVEFFGVDEFQKINIRDVVKKMTYPNLLFSIEDNEIEVSVDYKILEDYYSDEILCVKMDERLNVINFSHES